jgi:hypothetical protein
VNGLSGLTDGFILATSGLATISEHTLKGEGSFQVSVEQVYFQLNAKGLAPIALGKLRLQELDVDLGFRDLLLEATGEAKVDDETLIDWTNVGKGVEFYFHSLWNDEVKGLVNEIVRCEIDHVVNVSIRSTINFN